MMVGIDAALLDWLLLIVSVPAIIVPTVWLLGFAGCAPLASRCVSDVDCPAGTRCDDGFCFSADPALPPPSAPQNLSAIASSDRSITLSWSNTEPAATDFQIERAPENGEFVIIPPPVDLSPTGATDSTGLQEGATFIYRVSAVIGQERSEPSDTSSATVLPAAPSNLVATPADVDQIDLSWTNASATADEFSLEQRAPGGAFTEIHRGPESTFSHSPLAEGSQHEYRVFAIVVNGFEDSIAQEVQSAASPIVSAATLSFGPAFTAPPGTLTTDQTGVEGFCIVQRIGTALLTAGGTQVRVVLRGSTTGTLTLDRITISQAAAGDPYDSAADLTSVASAVTLAPNTPRTVGPVAYALDPARDLLVAFDFSNTPGQGNPRFGALAGADSFARAATSEASLQDRTTGYPGVANNNLYLIERIEVL